MQASIIKGAYCIRRRFGIAATELALTLPLLMLFAIACTDFGRISYYAEAVSNAARTGAETGAIQRFSTATRAAWETHIRQAVLHEVEHLPNFDPAKLETEVTTSTDVDGIIRIVVTVAYPFKPIVGWPGLSGEVRLFERVQYRQFR